MKYSPVDIATHNLRELVRNLRLQGVRDDEIREAMLTILEGLK